MEVKSKLVYYRHRKYDILKVEWLQQITGWVAGPTRKACRAWDIGFIGMNDASNSNNLQKIRPWRKYLVEEKNYSTVSKDYKVILKVIDKLENRVTRQVYYRNDSTPAENGTCPDLPLISNLT